MNIIIVDDDKLVCQALATILGTDPDFHITAIGNDGTEAITLYKEHEPDLLLMDIRMTHMTGLAAGAAIIDQYKDAKIIFLTTFVDNEYIIEALRIGAKGYLLKQDFDSIIPAIKAVKKGHRVFGDEIISKIPDMMNQPITTTRFSQYNLTNKEIEIITSVAQGLSNKEIAIKSFLGEGTVRNYISTILDKLQLKNRTQLAIFFYKNQ